MSSLSSHSGYWGLAIRLSTAKQELGTNGNLINGHWTWFKYPSQDRASCMWISIGFTRYDWINNGGNCRRKEHNLTAAELICHAVWLLNFKWTCCLSSIHMTWAQYLEVTNAAQKLVKYKRIHDIWFIAITNPWLWWQRIGAASWRC